MHDQPIGPSPDGPSQPAVEHALLTLLLDTYPAPLTLDEARRELTTAVRRDATPEWLVDDAVLGIVGAGLANRDGSLLLASRAAVRFHQLEQGIE